MILFKDIRDLIYSDLEIIIGDDHYCHIDAHTADDDFDNYEVIGIRSGVEYYDTFEEDKVVISLKKTNLADCNYSGHLNNMEFKK